MFNTFEMRWFFSECPLEASVHFGANSELQIRTDWYAYPCNPDCGIKLREGRLETKVRCQVVGKQHVIDFCGCLESYKKWSLQFPPDDQPAIDDLLQAGWLAVQKQRNLRRFNVTKNGVSSSSTRPVNGCEFELTKLIVRQGAYWTVGFEAVGTAERLEANLHAVLKSVAAAGGRQQPFDLEHSMGYAEWLSRLNELPGN